ncbi:uncharacterized protein AB675_2381 [Cyphellophora attinorum]|uniref:GH18 domain-containing protein n=1 Tax=Cyphellophora attinorum TaxID=1664694 RepID=A0A0N1P2E7_9EURO|nr:uncharacterized protein AB675_2381 [Phialophora attinorum]KPI45154.1 hypothetical protein AB675_2381 [Phialophora attinorum]
MQGWGVRGTFYMLTTLVSISLATALPTQFNQFRNTTTSTANSLNSLTNMTSPGALHRTFANMGYWPAWQDFDPKGTKTDSLTDVNYAFASIDANGSLHLGNDSGLRSWVQQKKHSPNLRVHLAV